MKLSRIRIDGYKNLINFEVHFEKFNILIGKNNSGKTNLLEIFYFLNLLLTSEDNIREGLFYGRIPYNNYFITQCKDIISRDIVTLELDFNDCIEEVDYSFFYTVQVMLGDSNSNREGYIIEESLRYKETKKTGIPKVVFLRKNEDILKVINFGIKKINKQESVLSIIRKLRDSIVSNQAVNKGIEYVFQISKVPVFYSSPTETKKYLLVTKEYVTEYGRIINMPISYEIVKILESENKAYYLELLQHILNIQDLDHFTLGKDDNSFKIVLVTFINGITVPLERISDGTMSVLSIITYLLANKHPIIAIEEIENSIHPKLLQDLVGVIRREFHDTQTILTTYSPVLLEMTNYNEVNIILTNNNGQAQIKRVSSDKMLVKRLSHDFANFSDLFFYDDIFEVKPYSNKGE